LEASSKDTVVGKAAKAAPLVVGAVIAVAAIAYLVGQLAGFGDDQSSSDAHKFESRIPPAEFVYLDGPRLLELLAELEGGEVGTVHQISKEIRSTDAGAEGGGFKIGASAQLENSSEIVVTRTQAAALGLLLAGLEDDPAKGVDYHFLNIRYPADLNEVREGMLVKFVTHWMLGPGYIRPYVVLRQSATLASLFPRSFDSNPEEGEFAEQRQQAEFFAHQIGPNPRLTFVIAPPPKHPSEKGLKILMPMQYRYLTQERSLLEKGRNEYTGGRLVIVGKVVREFKRPTRPHCDEGATCPVPDGPEYTDYATREIWHNPLVDASDFLIEHVSHGCLASAGEAEQEKQPGSGAYIEGKECFLEKLERQTEVSAPGLVILPVAIYK